MLCLASGRIPYQSHLLAQTGSTGSSHPCTSRIHFRAVQFRARRYTAQEKTYHSFYLPSAATLFGRKGANLPLLTILHAALLSLVVAFHPGLSLLFSGGTNPNLMGLLHKAPTIRSDTGKMPVRHTNHHVQKIARLLERAESSGQNPWRIFEDWTTLVEAFLDTMPHLLLA